MKLTICNGEKRPNLSHGICKRASRYRRRLRRNILSRIDPVTHIRIVSRGKRWRKGVELAIKGKTGFYSQRLPLTGRRLPWSMLRRSGSTTFFSAYKTSYGGTFLWPLSSPVWPCACVCTRAHSACGLHHISVIARPPSSFFFFRRRKRRDRRRRYIRRNGWGNRALA